MTTGTAAHAGTGIISIAGITIDGNPGFTNWDGYPSIDDSGRYVVFYSSYPYSSADTNGVDDVYVKDTLSGTLFLASTDSTGGLGNGGSDSPRISGNGRYIVFESTATNLVPGDNNSSEDVFVKDLQTNQTTRVSIDSYWTEGNAGSYAADISSDGRYVAFSSMANNLIAADSNGMVDVFVRDTVSNITFRASWGQGQVEGNGHSYNPGLSSNGRYVVFETHATNLIPSDTNGQVDILRRDIQTNTTTTVSTDSSGTLANNTNTEATVSADGRYVVFRSWANNLVAGDTNGAWDVFLKDIQIGTTSRVSTGLSGAQSNGNSFYPRMTSDNRYVVFNSEATNLVNGDNNSRSDIFVCDLYFGTNVRVTTAVAGTQGNGHSGMCDITNDGRYAVFDSNASNLDNRDTNSTGDVFIAPVGRQYLFTWYDNLASSNWLLLGNPAGATSQAWASVEIANQKRSVGSIGGGWFDGQLPSGSILTSKYAGLMGGPVYAGNRSDKGMIASQRILWGGKSFEEVTGMPARDLSDTYYWTWYDQQSTGYQNWVLVMNPSVNPVYYEIRIAGTPMSSGTINPNSYVTPQFPGVRGGPVEVKAWDTSSKSTTVPVMASQRVLINGQSFNEVVGTPKEALSDHYIWTWYDELSPVARNWVIVANHNAFPVYYEVKIAGTVYTSGTLSPGQTHTPQFPGLRAGPVEVQAWTSSGKGTAADVVSSQRITWGPSFDETPGFPVTDLSSEYHWTWYDQKSAGAQDWILVFNPNATSVYYEIYIGTSYAGGGTIAAGQSVTPQLPGTMGGPVWVRAWLDSSKSQTRNIYSSQRNLWNGYFNEVPGTVLN